MHIGRIEGATRVLGKSQGYLGLPVRDVVVNGSLLALPFMSEFSEQATRRSWWMSARFRNPSNRRVPSNIDSRGRNVAQEAKWEPEWRNAEDDAPARGSFVAVTRNQKDILARTYWNPTEWNLSGLLWRPAPLPRAAVLSHPAIPKDHDGFWYIVKLEPQLEVSTVWRVHELNQELFTPIVRERRPTAKRDKNGHKVCILKPKPMFRGYGFIRREGGHGILDVRGVADFLRNEEGKPVLLPHEAILAIFEKQSAEHQEFMREKGARVSKWKVGARVRVDEGSVYAGMVAEIEKLKGADRIVVLLGMAKIRHELPADMVVAA